MLCNFLVGQTLTVMLVDVLQNIVGLLPIDALPLGDRKAGQGNQQVLEQNAAAQVIIEIVIGVFLGDFREIPLKGIHMLQIKKTGKQGVLLRYLFFENILLTEIRVQKAFAKMMQGRTAFVVAHRLSTIKESDVILVMKDGNIIEQGSHAELLKKKGFYYKLYHSQFSE